VAARYFKIGSHNAHLVVDNKADVAELSVKAIKPMSARAMTSTDDTDAFVVFQVFTEVVRIIMFGIACTDTCLGLPTSNSFREPIFVHLILYHITRLGHAISTNIAIDQQWRERQQFLQEEHQALACQRSQAAL
jgi:hypothetical protein